ncbi:hypothetical protein ABCS64_09405 [Rhodocyclaceae bacterium Wk13]|uniref:Uncharacterized protein n=2 Tax=Dentiradicibacter hellwigii TaxID=3149053 RepID=A0ABV4UFY5_9RHOO
MHFYRHGRKVPAQQSFRQGQNRITANRLAEEIALAEQPVAYHFHPISACSGLCKGAIGSYDLFVKDECAAKLPAVSADAVFLLHRIAGRPVSPIERSNVLIERCPTNFSGGIGRYCPGVSAPDARQSANRRRQWRSLRFRVTRDGWKEGCYAMKIKIFIADGVFCRQFRCQFPDIWEAGVKGSQNTPRAAHCAATASWSVELKR